MVGTRTLLRHFLRRDRWHLVWWTLGITLLYWSQAVSVEGLYATQEEFDRAAQSMAANPAFVAMAGPARALNTVGGQVFWQASAFGAILAGLMSMFLVGRHTRAEEESGRDELLRAAPVHRLAVTTAGLGVALIANLVVGLAVSLSLVLYPLAAADSWATGLGLTVTGAAFAGLALLAAQLTRSTRSMYGIVGGVIGLSYLLRAIGDVSSPTLSWLSPIGWYQAIHAFSGVRWWPLFLPLLALAVTVTAAYVVFDRRDAGAGVLAERPGAAEGGRDLGSGLGLAWRLQRGSVLGWAAGLFLVGLAYGSMGTDIGDLMGDSELSTDLVAQAPGDLVDAFYATAVLMLAVIATGFAVSSALRPRGEEDEGRVEPLLAAPLARLRWLLGHVCVTVGGSVLVVLAAGVGLGVGFALETGDEQALRTYPVALLGYVAPVLVLAALARLLYGWAPRLASLAWLALVFVAVVMLFGEVFSMPQWLQDVSPFEHNAMVPAEDFRWAPVLALLAVATALSGLGHWGFTRRDVS